MSKMSEDPRIDPRIKAVMDALPIEADGDAESRDQMLAEANTPEALARQAEMGALMEMVDNEDIAPSEGLRIETLSFDSKPDGNTVKIQYIRPDSDETLPCVYYIHGGGMMSSPASGVCIGPGGRSSPAAELRWPWWIFATA